MTSPDAAAVDLTSLEIIRRYSLAVRQDTASRGEVVAALRADLAWLEGGTRTGTRSRSAVAETPRPTAPAAAPAKKAPAKAAAPAPTTKAAPAKKPAKKTSTPARTPAAKTSARRG